MTRFLYDFNSPYAYLASARVDEVLGDGVRWEPISFGFLLRTTGRRPWSFTEAREAGMRECERRAAEYGLPPIVWSEGWPVESYSLLPLRAAYVAQEHGRLREVSQALFAAFFARGEPLGDIEVVARAAEEAGVPADAVRAGVEREEIKARLRDATEAAIAQGVVGVPTVVAGDELFWGDDRLEDAAAIAQRG
ncbi:MAG TPA: DsbA family protein [Solirubrobacteraceae bacterium]|nr:DsbA family protein [Solirubrobacteraceae bacterium]